MIIILTIMWGIIFACFGNKEFKNDFQNDLFYKKTIKYVGFSIGYFINKKIKIPNRYFTKVYEKQIILYGRDKFSYKSIEFFSNKYFFHYLILIGSELFFLKCEKDFLNVIFFFIIGNFIVHYYMNKKLDGDVKIKKEKILVGFFEFSSKFTLLINSGMNFKNSLEGSIGDNEFSIYVTNAYKNIQSGKSLIFAFEEIALECRNPLINKYISCIIQALKRGNQGIENDLKKITSENWQFRINLYRKWGEELKTKLIFPMMLIFIGILMILMLPVFLQFGSLI